MPTVKVGIIGCGNISSAYFKAGQTFEVLDIVACADLDVERAEEKARMFNIPKACSVAELLADPDIQIVINLTIPAAHAEVCLAAIEAGKNVHVEKPLAVTREEGHKILKAAKEKGLRVGGAPDTFLGGGLQTCRKLIDDGRIGEPVSATAFMMNHGHENWHPSPEFYYQVGGGPMFDMGPYYLTALISLIGPIRRVTGSTQMTFKERTITSEPKKGDRIEVEIPTHISGVLDFQNGAVGTLITSFDVWHHRLPCIEIYGTEGSLSVPDPNGFGGPVFVRGKAEKEWTEIPLTHGFSDNSRGIGAADMAYAILNERAHRVNGDLAYHVLETMHGFHDASKDGQHYTLTSTCRRPEPLPVGISEKNFHEILCNQSISNS